MGDLNVRNRHGCDVKGANANMTKLVVHCSSFSSSTSVSSLVVSGNISSAPAAVDRASGRAHHGHLRYLTFFGTEDCNATAVAAMQGMSNLCISGNLTSLRAAHQAGMAAGLSLIDAQNILQQTPGQAMYDWGVFRKPDGSCLRNASCVGHWDGLGKRWKDTILCILGQHQLMTRPSKICLEREVPKLEVLFIGGELFHAYARKINM